MRSTGRGWGPALASLALGLALSTVAASAQDQLCDTAIRPIGGALGYGARGARCEGLYESPVSAVNLELVSLLRGKLRFDPRRHKSLKVISPDDAGAAQPIRVRAVALPIKTYYRMDGVLAADRTMVWPLHEVLARTGLTAAQLGVFAWVGAAADKLFIPLAVVPGEAAETPPGPAPPGPAPPGPASVELTVRTPVDIERMVWRARPDGTPVPAWQNVTAMPLVAGRSITLVLPNGAAAVMHAEVQAKRRNSDQWIRLRFRYLRSEE